MIFPLRQPPKPETETQQLVAAKAATIRILCIDDEPLLREMLKEILEFNPHKVEVADGGKNGLEALPNAQNPGATLDGFITDLGMPYRDRGQGAQTTQN